ncbi:DUF4347 domain-containing protein [Acidovorax temperans]|uniref:DUF4347 domain-containing protein n=1 Tax=Acidovorax temperans TaxID=80878 RepID=UPI0030CF0E88
MTDIATTASPARSIVFVDSRVQDAATLLQGLDPGTEVVFLQAGQDGLAQMAAALGDRGDVGAVQVIAHGSAGQLWLGSRFLDNTTLQQPEVQALLAALGRGLTAEGDLLIYACNTAEGSAGAQFVSTLAALTGADVAASDDRTGAGGDWDLEISTGSIEQATMLSAQGEAAYQHGLATLTVTTGADSGLDANFGADQVADLADGAGLSLREALYWAQNGDTVTFNADMTVSLSTKASADSLLILDKNLTIDGDWDNDGTADVTLDGQYKGRVLEVTTGTTAMLDGLVITQGLLAGKGGDAWEGVATSAADALGAGILNSGTLTVVNSTISANVATGGGGGGAGVGGAGGGGSGFNGIGGGAGGNQIYNNKLGAPGGMGIGGGGAADTPPPSGSTGGSAGSGPYVTRLGGNGGTSTDGGLGGLGYAPYSAPAGGKGGKVTGAGGGGGADLSIHGAPPTSGAMAAPQQVPFTSPARGFFFSPTVRYPVTWAQGAAAVLLKPARRALVDRVLAPSTTWASCITTRARPPSPPTRAGVGRLAMAEQQRQVLRSWPATQPAPPPGPTTCPPRSPAPPFRPTAPIRPAITWTSRSPTTRP